MCLTALRDRFIAHVLAEIPHVTLTGAPVPGLEATVPGPPLLAPATPARLPNNASFILKGVESEILLMRLDMEGIFASAGSACTAGKAEPSHVLLAMGFSKQEARTAVRFSCGRSTTEEALNHTLDILIKAVTDIRAESGVY